MSAAPYVTEEQIADVLSNMGDLGIPLKEACFMAELNYGNVRRRIKESETLTALHAGAREDYMETKVQSLNQIAKEEQDVARARLMCDNVKWEAARVLNKIYGDKIETTLAGSVNVVRDLTDADLASIAMGASKHDAS